MPNFFIDHGLESTNASRLFVERVGDPSRFRNVSPSAMMSEIWSLLDPARGGNASGEALSLAVTVVFILHGLVPLYRDAAIEGVPTHEWDCVLGTQGQAPLAVAVSMTLKERWKTENLASCILKSKYPGGHAVVLAGNSDDASKLRDRIMRQEVAFVDDAVCVFDARFDSVVADLRTWVSEAPPDPQARDLVRRTRNTNGPIR
jgi:hypothetical protein